MDAPVKNEAEVSSPAPVPAGKSELPKSALPQGFQIDVP